MDNHTINQHLDRLVAAATGRMMLPDHEVFELRQKIRDGVEGRKKGVPEGWSLWPDTATQEMRRAGNKALDELLADKTRTLADRAHYVYEAMRAAVPLTDGG